MAVYSYSKLETFEKCKLKYKFRYIDKIIPDIPKSIEAHLGTIVHASLEWLYNKAMEKEIPSITDLIEYYSEKWIQEYSPDFLIVNKDMQVEDYFGKGTEFLINYYLKHQPFQDNTIATEKKIEFNLDEEGSKKILGFVDRLTENLENNEIEIHDYKTANTIPQRQEIEKSKQLGLYSLAIKELFGKDKKVCMIWHYLAHDVKICLRKTNEELEKLRQDTIQTIDEIEATKTFPPSPSRLCDWCEYKNICPTFNNHQEKLYFNK